MVRPLAITLLAALAASGCGDLKPAGVSDGGNTGVVDAGGPATDGGRTGPGPHGSLPSGYCCTTDSECRYRHCTDVGNAKMCLDECTNAAFCTRPDITFTCPAPGSGSGLCQPPAGFACLDPQTFTRGSKEAGACCNAGAGGTNDGTAGSDCEGNQCAATGTGPLVCTHRCDFQKDCPDGFACTLFGTSKACVRTTSAYTCE